MRSSQESRRHHFVPQFLLRAWANGDLLDGYFWDSREQKIFCKTRGSKAFCFGIDLLTLKSHALGRDALEKLFFGTIDTEGAKVYDRIIAKGVTGLALDERREFARFLLSLEARRPAVIEQLREQGRKHFVEGLDSDERIRSEMMRAGLEMLPSELLEQSGISLVDRALIVVQRLTDNPRVGGRLLNLNWRTVRLADYEGSFVLSDRPLIRVLGYKDPKATWVLPLTPKLAFVASASDAVLSRIKTMGPRKFSKLTNISSVAQAERFVFCTGRDHMPLLRKYLPDIGSVSKRPVGAKEE
jgi:hypothetical protein